MPVMVIEVPEELKPLQAAMAAASTPMIRAMLVTMATVDPKLNVDFQKVGTPAS